MIWFLILFYFVWVLIGLLHSISNDVRIGPLGSWFTKFSPSADYHKNKSWMDSQGSGNPQVWWEWIIEFGFIFLLTVFVVLWLMVVALVWVLSFGRIDIDHSDY